MKKNEDVTLKDLVSYYKYSLIYISVAIMTFLVVAVKL